MTHFETVRHVTSTILTLAVPFLVALSPTASSAQEAPTTRFQVSFPASAHDGPVTGRVFVMISTTDEREPRLQIGREGVPFFGQDVMQLETGDAGIIDETALGC